MFKSKQFAIGLAVCQGVIILSLLFWLLQRPTAVHAFDWNVNTFTDASDNDCFDVTCSLRDAIAAADPSDTIYLPAGSYVLSAGLGEINIAKTITIIGQGATAADTIIDGDSAIRLFNISSGTVTFSNLTLQNGQPASGNGGAILTSGTGSVTLDNSIIRSSTTQGNGGGIYLAGGTLNILNGSQILGNTAVSTTIGNGGGIYNNNGSVFLTGSTIANNSAQFGGGISLNQPNSQLTINNGQILNNEGLAPGPTSFPGGGINSGAGSVIMNSGLISGNTAFRGGGALISSGSLTLNGGTITDNESNYGGGVYVRTASALLTINEGTISGNRSVASIFGGGALYIFQGRAVQNGGEISGNTAVNFGGAMEVRMGSFQMNGGIISGNSAGNWGGAIYNDQGFITITNGTLTGNSSLLGGGAIATGGTSSNTISRSVLYSNNTNQNGGAILNTGTLTLTNVTLSDNEAGSGGGLHNQGTASLTNVTIFENTAAANGGGLHGSSGTLNVVNSILAGNSAASGPDCAGTIVSQGYNLIQNGSCAINGSTTGHIGGDPQLETLALNGGSTLNHALSPSSPALDTGDNATCAPTDQRGAPRPLDGNEDSSVICDMGAFEYGTSPGLSIADASLSEGNGGTKTIPFTVTLFPASETEVTVNYTTSEGTAIAGEDYNSQSNTLTFAPFATEQIIEITLHGDTTDEWDETFLVTLSNPSPGILLHDATAQGTILNDDTPPELNIASTSVTEGNDGTTTAAFTATLSAASGKTIAVDYATLEETAVAPTDYHSQTSQLEFAPGETEKFINIVVNGDTTDEEDETFWVNLSNPQNAVLGSEQASGTILNDDTPPALSTDDIVVMEGDSGTTDAVFTVSLDEASGKIITVNYETQAVSATAGTDYAITSGTLTFNPGESDKTITVLVVGDTVDEDDETFLVKLSGATNATLSEDEDQAQGQATIIDNDGPPVISIADVTVSEGAGTAVFTISLSHPSSKIVTVDVQSSDGSATAGEDYTAVPLTTLTFNPGEPLSQTVSVTIHDDDMSESSETFLLTLSNPGNATLGSSSATGAISDDDGNFVYIPFVITP